MGFLDKLFGRDKQHGDEAAATQAAAPDADTSAVAEKAEAVPDAVSSAVAEGTKAEAASADDSSPDKI